MRNSFEINEMTDKSRKDTEKSSLLLQAKLWAIFAAIVTPGAFLIGSHYYEGYLSAFGLSPDELPMATSNVYVLSYSVVGYFLLAVGEVLAKWVNSLFDFPDVLYTLVLLAGFVLVVYLGLKGRRKIKVGAVAVNGRFARTLRWLNPHANDGIKAVFIVFFASYGVVALSIGFAAIAVFWWIIPVASQAKGVNNARERIVFFHKNGCVLEKKTKWNNCFVILDDRGAIAHQGILVGVSDRSIAMYKKEGLVVVARKDSLQLMRKNSN